MFERIAEIEARYQELEDKLGQPELARDPGKLRELTQELASLRELITAYRAWKDTSRVDRRERGARDDPDPEIRELAKAELAGAAGPPRGARNRAEEAPPAARPARPEERRARDPARHRRRRGVALRGRPVPHVHALRPGHEAGASRSCRSTESDGGGVREVIASIAGQAVYGRLKYESGVHRVQRVPATESQGRIHTSTATVAVLPEADDGGHRDRREGPAHRPLPRGRPGRPERQHHRLGDPRHAHPDGLGRSVPGREVAAQEQGQGDQGPARAPVRPGAAAASTPSARPRARARSARATARAHPHLQLPAEPRHRSPRRLHPAPARPRHGGRDRRADRGREHEPRGRGAARSRHERRGVEADGRSCAGPRTSSSSTTCRSPRLDAELLLAHVLERASAWTSTWRSTSRVAAGGPRALPRAGAAPRQGALAGRLPHGRARVLVDALPRDARRADPAARDRDAGAGRGST